MATTKTSLEQKLKRMTDLMSQITSYQQSAQTHKENFDKQTKHCAEVVDQMIKARNPKFTTLKEYVDDCMRTLTPYQREGYEKDMRDVWKNKATDKTEILLEFIYQDLWLRGGLSLVSGYRTWIKGSDAVFKVGFKLIGTELSAKAAAAAHAAAEIELQTLTQEARTAEALSERAALRRGGQLAETQKTLILTQEKLGAAKGLSTAEKATLEAIELEQKALVKGLSEAMTTAAAAKVAAKAMVKKGLALAAIGGLIAYIASRIAASQEKKDQERLYKDIQEACTSRLYSVLYENHALNMVSLPAAYSSIAVAKTDGNKAIIDFQIDQFIKLFETNDKGVDEDSIYHKLASFDKVHGANTTDDPDLNWMKAEQAKIIKKAEEGAAAEIAAAEKK